jgi:hypothetical protein
VVIEFTRAHGELNTMTLQAANKATVKANGMRIEFNKAQKLHKRRGLDVNTGFNLGVRFATEKQKVAALEKAVVAIEEAGEVAGAWEVAKREARPKKAAQSKADEGIAEGKALEARMRKVELLESSRLNKMKGLLPR